MRLAAKRNLSFFALALFFSIVFCSPLSLFAQRNVGARTSAEDVERKINALVAKMTLAEKLGQLQMLDGEANGKYRPEH
ncbi:MAG: hypothetical protein ABI891_14680, partial [Acidobacteriota bacterium]